MANRFGQQFSFSMIKQTWSIYAKCTFGSAGAVTLVQGSPAASPGIVSVTKNATGQYTFVFGTQAGMLDVWPRFLHASVYFDAGASAAAAPIMATITNSSATAGTCSIKVRLVDYAGADASPADGEIGYFKFVFSNSTAS
jgi:hypothetical protein